MGMSYSIGTIPAGATITRQEPGLIEYTLRQGGGGGKLEWDGPIPRQSVHTTWPKATISIKMIDMLEKSPDL